MVDSMNARRGAANKMTNEDFRKFKYLLREKYDFNHNNIQTSEYFEYFDESEPKIINLKHQYFLQIAARVAMNSTMNHKHGAIIVHKNNIIASGCNYSYAKFSIHAEVAAISQLKGKEKEILPECKLYVVRIGPDKYNFPLKYSKPCNSCQSFICKNLIKKTYYSTNYEYDQFILQC